MTETTEKRKKVPLLLEFFPGTAIDRLKSAASSTPWWNELFETRNLKFEIASPAFCESKIKI
jgi:hypothetical protein